MAKMVIGVFSETEEAENAMEDLKKMNYNPKDISIVMKERDGGDKVINQTGTTHVGSGTMSGVATGGVLGALASLLVIGGIVPGLGAIFIGGPLAAALGLTGVAATAVSAAATGALAGGIVGALSGLGLSGREAVEYEESIKSGGILVAVPARIDHEDEVKDVLQNNHADQIRVMEHDEKDHSSRTISR